MKRIIYKSTLALFTVGLMMIASCSKEEGQYGDSGKNATAESQIKKVIEGLPQFQMKNGYLTTKNNGVQDGFYTDGGWDFSNPGGGYHYSSGGKGISYSSSSNTFTLAATGGGHSGGTVVAGTSALDMNYTFCFSIDDNVNGISSFANAASTNVAGVIGVSGDFDKLSGNASDFTKYFFGIAYYIVFSDGAASGDYEVIDWNDPAYSVLSLSNKKTHNKCFAVLVDFKNGAIYMSSKGKINVSGGTMNFDGSYYSLTGFKIDKTTGNWDTSTAKFSEVSGFGAMGCN